MLTIYDASLIVSFFFEGYGDHRDLHVLTHSCPTRRSSDLCLGHAARRPCRPYRLRMADPPFHRSRGELQVRRRQGLYARVRSEEHTSELQSLMRISYAVFCLKKKKPNHRH